MPSPSLEIEWSPHATSAWRRARDEAGAGPHLGDGWIAYRRGLGVAPRHLLVRDAAGAIDSVGVAYLSRPRFRPWVRPAAQVDALPLPVDGAPSGVTAATDRARALVALARPRWRALAIDSFGGPTPPPDLAAAGCTTRERLEFTVDLRPDDDARWSAIKPSHRRKIRKAEKAGVAVELRDDAAAELAALQQFTSERRAARGEDMQGLGADRFRALIAALRGDVLCAVGTLDGAAVSAMLVATHGARAYYMLGGTDAAGLTANAASLVFWRTMQELRGRGIGALNLGGVPASAADPESPAHGLYRFKLGWGAPPAPCRSGTWQAAADRRPKQD